ncbi:MAG: MT-A70 family methyltransferase, partial [Candidatus Binatia bacterium]
SVIEDNQKELLALSKLEAEERREVVEQIAGGKAKSVKAAKKQMQADKIKQEPPPLPRGPYRVIVVDPPWQYHNRADDDTHRAANPYPSLSLDEIRALPIGEMAEEDCILWLWTTNAHLPEAFGIVQAWGFEYKTLLTWVKDKMGLGDWLRGPPSRTRTLAGPVPRSILPPNETTFPTPLTRAAMMRRRASGSSRCPGSSVVSYRPLSSKRRAYFFGCGLF